MDARTMHFVMVWWLIGLGFLAVVLGSYTGSDKRAGWGTRLVGWVLTVAGFAMIGVVGPLLTYTR